MPCVLSLLAYFAVLEAKGILYEPSRRLFTESSFYTGQPVVFDVGLISVESTSTNALRSTVSSGNQYAVGASSSVVTQTSSVRGLVFQVHAATKVEYSISC